MSLLAGLETRFDLENRKFEEEKSKRRRGKRVKCEMEMSYRFNRRGARTSCMVKIISILSVMTVVRGRGVSNNVKLTEIIG